MTGSDKHDTRLTELAVRAANSTSALSLVAGSASRCTCDLSVVLFTTENLLLEWEYNTHDGEHKTFIVKLNLQNLDVRTHTS
jgi:hypothetical protein